MNYELEKLEFEFSHLKTLWSKLRREWEIPSDSEDLYRIYPYFTTTAALIRKFIYWGIEINYQVSVVMPKNTAEVNCSEFLYRDEHGFFNGTRKTKSLKGVSSLLLHQHEYGYVDDRKANGIMDDKVSIFLHAKTDLLCRSCAEANNGRYVEDMKNYKKKGAFIRYTDCECGIYINISSYVDAIEKAIKTIRDKT